MIARAGKVFFVGLGEDGIPARAFASKLALLGILTVHQRGSVADDGKCRQPRRRDDVLLVFSEHGKQPALSRICAGIPRAARQSRLDYTQHAESAARPCPCRCCCRAHDERPYIEPLLYQCALQHLLDLIFVSLCDTDRNRRTRLDANLERAQRVLDP